jgi:hypothetical protein
MWTKVLIVLLCIPLILGSSGCVVTGWILPNDHGPDTSLGGLSRYHPAPGSAGYKASVVMGFIGDGIWTLLWGIGILFFVIDALYLWVMGGGYAERWYAAYGHTLDDGSDDERDDRRPRRSRRR